MVRLFVARQKETRQGKTTRKGDRGSLQQRGQNQDAYREDKWQELSSSVWFGDPGQLIYSSPCPSCSLGLILGWQRQLAILSVCRRGCDSNKKQLLTLQSLHLPTEKPFSLRETPTKTSKSQRGPIQCLRVIDVPCEECSPPCIPEHSDRSTGDMKMTPCGSLLHDKTVGPNFESTSSVLFTTLLCWRQAEGRTRGSFSSDWELW